MSERLPYFQVFPRDWLGSVPMMGLTVEQEGVHLRLLLHAWQLPGCALPDEPGILENMARLMPGSWAEVGQRVLDRCWRKRAGAWVPVEPFDLPSQMRRASELVAKKRRAGKQSAAVRQERTGSAQPAPRTGVRTGADRASRATTRTGVRTPAEHAGDGVGVGSGVGAATETTETAPKNKNSSTRARAKAVAVSSGPSPAPAREQSLKPRQPSVQAVAVGRAVALRAVEAKVPVEVAGPACAARGCGKRATADRWCLPHHPDHPSAEKEPPMVQMAKAMRREQNLREERR
jgi:uncharacterized protein YdaU (DUF1376 family)